MNDLTMLPKKIEQMDKMEDLSMEAINAALNDEIDADGDKVKVAVKMMGVVAKNRQTLTHRKAVDFNMAGVALSDEQLRKYVNATSPQIKKALGA